MRQRTEEDDAPDSIRGQRLYTNLPPAGCGTDPDKAWRGVVQENNTRATGQQLDTIMQFFSKHKYRQEIG